MTLSVCGLVLAILGPGEWSLDHAIGLTGLWGWTGLWIALAVGVGGSAVLLITSWRPQRGQKNQLQDPVSDSQRA